MKVTNKITIHLDDPRLVPPIDVMQADAYTRELELSLYSGGAEWPVPDGVSVAVAYSGASGKGIYDTLPDGSAACSVAGNVVAATLIPQVLAVPGHTEVAVVFTDGNGKQLATFCVTLKVAANPAVGAVKPSDYINLRQWMSAYLDAHPEATTTVQDGSIGLRKLTADMVVKVPGNNLFTGFQTVTDSSGVEHVATNFIPVGANSNLSFVTNVEAFMSFATFDDSGQIIKIANTAGTGIVSTTVDEGATQFAFVDNGPLSNTAKITWIIASTSREDYVQDEYYLNGEIIRNFTPEIPDGSIGLKKLGDDIVTYCPSNNLFDADKRADDTVLDVSNLSNWIPVKKGVTYASSANYTQFYFFDSDKNHISTTTLITYPAVFTPDNDGYVLIKTPDDNTIVVEGTDLSNYYAAYYLIKPNLLPGRSNSTPWNGKKWLVIGDSITDPAVADQGYPSLVGSALGLTVTNVGSSGKIMSYFHDLISGYSNDFDLVTVMLGTNNHGYNCAIGELNDSGYVNGDYSSFYAQTQRMVELLLEKYPNSVVAFLTPIRRTAVGEGASNNDDGYQINALGLTTEPYAEVVKDVCDYYGIPCLDLWHYGINPKSEWMRKAYFLAEDGSDGTHPSNAGHAKYIAPAVNAFLERIAPLTSNSGDEETS